MGSPIDDMLDSQQNTTRTMSLCVIVFFEAIMAIMMFSFVSGPFGFDLTSLLFMLAMAIAVPFFLFFMLRAQSGFYSGFKRAARTAEARALPKYCPQCGASIDLDELEWNEGLDHNCPFCGARL
ncbi:MAG: hypothetical protein EAX95_00220 [Candidatus Thorarchaeota archaeon]|nr:hypothetical protein [Candidatus Thorarchaeota archaeon]